jgi:SAM-dependent methyltransferase
MTTQSKSLTHVHIYNCIATIAQSMKTDVPIKILDAGCGNGELISYLYRSFQDNLPLLRFDIYGFDVIDHGVQSNGYGIETLALLEALDSSVDWKGRIQFFTVGENWRYDSNYFDFIVSNQVLEHVQDKYQFFKNIHRCLKNNGYSFNLAPLVHCMHEGHIWIPFAHRIRSYDFLLSYIKTASRLRIGKYKAHHASTGVTLDEFSRRHADYMMFWTSYASQASTLDIARKANLRCDFRFTKEFYFIKVRRVLRIRLPLRYNPKQSAFVSAILIRVLRYVSSVTLTLQKGNDY